MNRIAELLSEVTMLQRKKQELHEVNTQLDKVILEWQDICSHPMEYLDEQEDGTIKCCACAYVLPKEETVPVLGSE